jgi:cell division protein FtsW
MKALIKNLKGDKTIWAVVALLAIVSFLPVYSASSNLAYGAYGSGNTFSYLIKHLAHVGFGFFIIYVAHRVPYNYFRALSIIGIPIIVLLLLYTLLQGKTIGGANASRWIQIPFIGVGFQTSTFASVVLMLYVARYLAKIKDKAYTFKSSLWELWLPVFVVVALVLPANFSTAAIMFSMVVMLVFIGEYPFKYLARVIVSGLLFLAVFILAAKAFPGAFPNRVDTWMSRIENFTSGTENEEEAYQIEKAKIAIATGGINGLGPGKSVQRNFLPQSSSDFIYAIIVEEYGLIGAFGVIVLYLILFFRFLRASIQARNLFGTLVVAGLGFPIIFQAFINMGVAVELFPTTGQTLPLISSGGSSIWMTCLAIGIILNVTKKEEEIKEEEKEKMQREKALERLIEKEIKEEEEKERLREAGIEVEEKDITEDEKIAVKALKNL